MAMMCHQEPCPDVPNAPTWIQVISSLQILCQDPRLSELPYKKGSKRQQKHKSPRSEIKQLLYDRPQAR